jgi:hypothetical protein
MYVVPVADMEGNGMTKAGVVVGVVVGAAFGASVMSLPARAADQIELPAGTNRDVVQNHCKACHDLQVLIDTGGLSREDWSGALDQMADMGAKLTPDERAKVLDYLATYLAPK